ncbi:hypothetical protein P170DRAFT_464428 [Aspergillus steynii IBT 23096]|uniref:C2H2-type domain-containing protein n=1 Tax=Aspergillus steynii IBT 23096 TaxID=1392250 RepID=A0A2I2G7I1_9EURO|nr:uncharacterized protein P170DRAFT_464428 [Aspergillus steynii IBT 23096]PLB48840.1 hypothetical protein P170DRAFT_464428 [Aspergillus steynii IBT 23096]
MTDHGRRKTDVICPYCCCTLSSATVLADSQWMNHVIHDLNPYVAVLSNRSNRSSGPLFQSCPLCGQDQVESSMEAHVADHLEYLALNSFLSEDPKSEDFNARTHAHPSGQSLRCPFVTCESRKYGYSRERDWIHHIFAHSGLGSNISCGFCPKPHGRLDRFDSIYDLKHHLVAFHGVTKPSGYSHKSQQPGATSSASACARTTHSATHDSNVTGMCYVCSVCFDNAQALYQHLDDCVIRAVHQEAQHEQEIIQRRETRPHFLSTIPWNS